MATITIAGNAAVITSAIKVADITKMKKYNPAALTLKDEKEKPIFMIDMGEKASVSNAGIIFNGTSRDGNGYATATFDIGTVEDAEAYVMDKVGFSILRLNELEDTIGNSVAAIDDKLNAVKSTITVMGVVSEDTAEVRE